MNGAVIYSSKYGSTQQYAEWISESMKMKLLNANRINVADLADINLIIFCSPVYFGKLLISKFINKNSKVWAGKKIYLLVVAGIEENAAVNVKSYVELNFKPDFQKQLKWFYVGGGMNINKLGFMEKLVVKILRKIVKDPLEKKKLEEGYSMVDRKKLEPIIDIIKKEM